MEPRAIWVPAGRSSRARDRPCRPPRIAPSMASGSWPSRSLHIDHHWCQPGQRSGACLVGESEREALAVDVMPLSVEEHHGAKAAGGRPARMASWLMPSIRQPSPAKTQVQCPRPCRQNRGSRRSPQPWRSPRNWPKPWPTRAGGWVSIPSAMAVFGVTGGARAPLAEGSSLLQPVNRS